MNYTPTEAQSQIAFVEWCARKHIPVAHIPNEGVRTAQQGAYLKSMGMAPGFPDLFIPIAANDFHGLTIEMKRPGNKQTDNQHGWQRILQREGYFYAVCYSTKDAIEVTTRYLKG